MSQANPIEERIAQKESEKGNLDTKDGDKGKGVKTNESAGKNVLTIRDKKQKRGKKQSKAEEEALDKINAQAIHNAKDNKERANSATFKKFTTPKENEKAMKKKKNLHVQFSNAVSTKEIEARETDTESDSDWSDSWSDIESD